MAARQSQSHARGDFPQSSFRHRIRSLVLCSMLGALFLGCGGGEAESSSQGSTGGGGSDERSNEPIIISMPADVLKLDPPQPTDANSLTVITHLYDRLVDFHPTELTVEPGLAESWVVSEDGKRYSFKLREGVAFDDGTPVDSEAVRFTFERIVDQNHPAYYAVAWNDTILGDWFDHIETPDPLTVVFVLKRPFSPLLFNLAIPAASIVNPVHLLKVGEDGSITQPSGSGPYRLEEWKQGNYVKLVAKENHWRGKPETSVLFFRPQPDMNQRASALRRGDVHLVPVLAPQTLDRNNMGEGQLQETPQPSLGYIVLNTQKDSLKEKALRQALNYAIDRESICDGLLEGTSIPAYGILPPGMIGYREAKGVQYRYDPEKAKALVKEAGAEGRTIELLCFDADRPYNVAGKRLAERLQEDFRKVGLNITMRQMDFGGFLDTLSVRTAHEMALTGWMADTGDPDNFIYTCFGVPSNRANYQNPEANRLMEDAAAETDVEKRAELYAQAEDLILEDAPLVPINFSKKVVGVNKRLRGYQPHPIMGPQLWTAYLVNE